jgi:ADP-ribose pyrophosphatase YjhB (NUDIX family)
MDNDAYSSVIKSLHNFTHKVVVEHSLNVQKNYSFTKEQWADPSIELIESINDPLWNTFNINNRMSNHNNSDYLIDGENNTPLKSGIKGAPLYPGGRTGLCGRGLLGKWGPNFAADPIITRKNPLTGKLEMILITRSDTGELAIPGGMVDPGEIAKTTALRELFEEALGKSSELGNFKDLFDENAVLIYKGCVDDPRNTDNAWMETSVYYYHITNPEIGNAVYNKLQANDDALTARFMCIEPVPLNLYASHADYINVAIKRLQYNKLFITNVEVKIVATIILAFCLVLFAMFMVSQS